MSEKVTVKGKYLMYRGRPLVREANTICYGYMEDKHYLMLTIMNNTEINGVPVPDKVLVQLVSSDQSLPSRERIVKQDLKTGLYDAFEIGVIWLDRYNAQ